MSSFGALVEKHKDGEWTVDGFGVGGFAEPKKEILNFEKQLKISLYQN